MNIKISRNEQHFNVEISDTGCGIPKENMGKLFTPFFTTKKMGKGTGLGLAIVYGIIKMHKGDVRAVSEAGRGTTFIITIPVILK
jgi:signal transduction histidine kinase